jgi:putative transposase
MGTHIYKSHNASLLMYHIVCTVKYRKSLIDPAMEEFIKELCLEISERFEIHFLEIGSDINHIHFLIQSVPILSLSKIVQLIKGNLAKQLFLQFPHIKKQLWGGEFWTDGYYVNTVSQYGGEKTISRYIQNQGKNDKTYKSNYKQLYKNKSNDLFEPPTAN